MTTSPHAHAEAAANKARQEAEKEAAAPNAHRGNINTNAYSEESCRKPGDITTHSINEPGPDAPKPFKVPEDHTATTPETLKRDYPDGYVAPVPPEEVEADIDPEDDLEDEIDQAKEEGDFKSMHRSRKPKGK